ncbi:hypothetical protein B0H10DRAFT_1941763 [Mycena sp. CBHHK59/15]|nr:hypothetical protein B0H10DRAFT_1941763 [Mycena sp. CBHHK59/15]
MTHNMPQRSTGTSGPQAGRALMLWAPRAESAGMWERREGDVAGVDVGVGRQVIEASVRGLQSIYQETAWESNTAQKMEGEVLPQVAGKRRSAMSHRASLVLEGGAVQPRRLLARYTSHRRDTRGIVRGLGRGDTDSLEEMGGQGEQRRATPATNHLVTIKSHHPLVCTLYSESTVARVKILLQPHTYEFSRKGIESMLNPNETLKYTGLRYKMLPLKTKML